MSGPPSATWRDIKQLGWTVLLVIPYIAVVCIGAAGLVGTRAAFWIGAGLVALTVITFGLLVVVGLLVSYGDDVLQRWLRRHHRRLSRYGDKVG